MRPLDDRVVVRQDQARSKTDTGILLPDIAKEYPVRGTVVAVGKGRLQKDGTRTPMQVKEGDQIYFANHAGNLFKYNDEDLLVMREVDILAVAE